MYNITFVRSITSGFKIFMDYTPFKVIIQYWLHLLCCTIYLCVCVCVRACMRMYTYMPTQACLTFCDPTDISPSPRRRNAKKAKWLSQEALQIAEKRREAKRKGEKER